MPRTTTPTSPKYLLHKASGRGRVRVNGRDYYLPGPHDSPESQRAYHRFCQELLATGSPPDRPIDRQGRLCVADLVLKYYRYRKTQGLHPRTLTGVVKPNLRRLRLVYGDQPADEIGPRQVGVVLHNAVNEGLSRSTINTKLLRTIKQMYRWAAREELVSTETYARIAAMEPLRRGENGATEREPVTPVSDKTVEHTLEHLGDIVADMVRVQRLTAMRPGEVCSLRWSEIDTAGIVWHYRPKKHKTAHHGKSREIAIGPKSQAILMRYRSRPEDLPIFSPKETASLRSKARRAERRTPLGPKDQRLTLAGEKAADKRTGRAGDGYTTQSYGYAIRRACSRAGITSWSPNQLRHAAATEMRARVGIQDTSDYLGHAKPDTTAIYAEVRRETVDDIAKRYG